MKAAVALALIAIVAGSALDCGTGPREPAPRPAPRPRVPPRLADATPEQLFVTYCSVCHSLELPRSQRLDRATWEWVVSDMVNEFGASWISEEQQKTIVDYLVKNYGPERP